MDTRCSSAVLDEARDATCSSFQGHRLAVGTQNGSLAVFERAAGDQGWNAAAASWQAHEDTPVTQVAWADSADGGILATSCGHTVCVWRERPDGPGAPAWQLADSLRDVQAPVVALRFAPRQHIGLWLAVASASGDIGLYRPGVPLPGQAWGLDSQLWQIGGAEATGLAWRPTGDDSAVPPMLVVGCSSGASAWTYSARHGSWAQAAQLEGPAASAVAWAPTLGRPKDLVAVASGSSIAVWSLSGSADSLQVGRTADLEAGAPVWQLEFSRAGSWLAASTDGGEVVLFRPALDGTWQLVTSVQGEEPGTD